MFTYSDENGGKVIFIREKCRCATRRYHMFKARVTKFCFCWEDVSGRTGLFIIALMTIFWGLLLFIIYGGLSLRGSPSGITHFLLFPFLAITLTCNMILFVGLGFMLLLGLKIDHIGLIKTFPWGLLGGYIFAIIIIVVVFFEGEFIIKARVWSDNGMNVKSDPSEANKLYIKRRIIFYSVMAFITIAFIFFTTYITILSLSCIDKMEAEYVNYNRFRRKSNY